VAPQPRRLGAASGCPPIRTSTRAPGSQRRRATEGLPRASSRATALACTVAGPSSLAMDSRSASSLRALIAPARTCGFGSLFAVRRSVSTSAQHRWPRISI
jgi:hypothetical protein